jgi:putative spermidine/putrescine transport system substrate-binding protein
MRLGLWAATFGLFTALAAPLHAQPAQPSGQITLVGYADIFQDHYRAAVVEPFMRRFPNIRVNYFPGNTSAQTLGMVRGQRGDPQTDVVIFDVTTAMIGNREGLFERISEQDAPALAELFPDARGVAGEGFGPAVTWDHLVIIYDAQRVQPAPTSLRALWNPALRGQIGISAPPNIQGLALTAIIARMEGADFRQTIDPAIARLRELAPLVATFEPQPDGATMVLGGQLLYATHWNARAQLQRDLSNGRLGVLLPPEGSVFQINTINVTAGTKNRAAAMAFVNYAIGQEAQKTFTERMFYAPVNARAQIAPAAVARTAAGEEARARMIPLDWGFVTTVRDQWNNRWRREVIAGSGR